MSNLNFELISGDSLDVLKGLKSNLFQTCVTSPPYWALREYFFEGAVVLNGDLSEEEKLAIEKELESHGVEPESSK